MSKKATFSEASRNSLAFRFYDLVTGDDDARLCRDIPDAQCIEQPKNFAYQVLAQALSKEPSFEKILRKTVSDSDAKYVSDILNKVRGQVASFA